MVLIAFNTVINVIIQVCQLLMGQTTFSALTTKYQLLILDVSSSTGSDVACLFAKRALQECVQLRLQAVTAFTSYVRHCQEMMRQSIVHNKFNKLHSSVCNNKAQIHQSLNFIIETT